MGQVGLQWHKLYKTTIILTNIYNFSPRKRTYFWFRPLNIVDRALTKFQIQTSGSQVMSKTV